LGGWGTVAAVAATVAVLTALAAKAGVALSIKNRSNAPPGEIVSPIGYCQSKCAANMRPTVCRSYFFLQLHVLFLLPCCFDSVFVIAPFASLI
jgi:hypothetical protein